MKKILAGAVVLCLCSYARADLATYTETIVASGSLAGTSFSHAMITLTATGNTADIVAGSFPNVGIRPGDYYLPVSATVEVSGVGSATFTDQILVFDNQTHTTAGFDDLTITADILDTVAAPLGSYDLSTAIGPTTGSSITNLTYQFATSRGAFEIDSVSGNATFSASVQAIPEPASLILMGLGSLGVLGYVRRRKPAAFYEGADVKPRD